MTNLSYILKQDILNIIDSGTLLELTGGRREIGTNAEIAGDDAIWQGYIKNAVELVKAYSRHWYDIDTEMRSIYEYDVLEDVTEGTRIASEEDSETGVRTLYIALQDAPAGTLLTDTAYFEQTDDRNPVLVEITSIFIIYNTSRRLNSRQIPEQRQIDYDNAMSKLKDIQNGKTQFEITERNADDIETDDAGQQVAWGEFEGETDLDY